ncbi:MAG: aminotransferase class V-fold PLP-dependent enzyme, partial [Abditibacteriales bacterium]|nr:aminotransferase class V-fold PLP-dependent enzyme [Abditibacteriales bacterium]MDW8368513.1 aminotransferase class V-fold PLP-dependent enzyme [Abditibacteriales bacterium]
VTASLLNAYQRIGEETQPLSIGLYVKEETRQMLAGLINADAQDIALTRGVSDAMSITLNGFDWREGDELIITDEEHPAYMTPATNLMQRKGVVVKLLETVYDGDALVKRLKHLLTPRTKLIALSHVLTDSGTRLPAKELTRTAHAYGVPIAWDGAHAVGQFPVDVQDIDADIYHVLSYKWTLGPYSVGFMYCKPELARKMDVAITGARAEKKLTYHPPLVEYPDTARRFEYGPFPTPLFEAWAVAVQYLNGIGFDAIEKQSHAVAAQLRDALKQIDGVRIFSPEDAGMSTGIVQFGIEGLEGGFISEQLRTRWNIIQRGTAIRFSGVRISCAFFINEKELSPLIEAVATIARERRG